MAIGAQMHIIGGHSLDGSWGPEDNVKLGKVGSLQLDHSITARKG